jgi:hypothetical protein
MPDLRHLPARRPDKKPVINNGDESMKSVPVSCALLAALFTTACSGDTTSPGPRANVRFFNATTGMTGRGGFTTNGEFASGAALASGQSSCFTVDAGATSFGFGSANSAGTGLSGNALATLSSQNITDSGNYTLAATGSGSTPTLYLFDNTVTGTVGANQAAVRFVNLAPGAVNLFTVFTGTLGSGGTLTASSIEVGAPTTFNTVASGSNTFTILNGHDIVLSGSTATLDLQARSVNTIAIVPNATSGGYQLINLPRC